MEAQIQAAERGELTFLKLMAKLSEMQCDYQKDVTKEMQRNDFCYSHLQPVLNELGFIAKPSNEQSDICLFGNHLWIYIFTKNADVQLGQRNKKATL